MTRDVFRCRYAICYIYATKICYIHATKICYIHAICMLLKWARNPNNWWMWSIYIVCQLFYHRLPKVISYQMETFSALPVNSPHKGKWCGALFSLICSWLNTWVNNDEAGDLRRYRTHHDVIAMVEIFLIASCPRDPKYIFKIVSRHVTKHTAAMSIYRRTCK